MKLKTILVIFLLLLINSITVNAQRQMSVDRRLSNLTQTLNLSEEQQVAVKDVLLTQKNKFDTINATDRTTRRAEMQKIMAETNAMILPILNEEQQARFNELMKSQMQNRGGYGNQKQSRY